MASQRLPYGLWLVRDGSECLFDRGYHAIYRRWPGYPATPECATKWISWTAQAYFYSDGRPRASGAELRSILQNVMDEFIAGRDVRHFLLTEPPRLVIDNQQKKSAADA